jgi:hypothetical protein
VERAVAGTTWPSNVGVDRPPHKAVQHTTGLLAAPGPKDTSVGWSAR